MTVCVYETEREQDDSGFSVMVTDVVTVLPMRTKMVISTQALLIFYIRTDSGLSSYTAGNCLLSLLSISIAATSREECLRTFWLPM